MSFNIIYQFVYDLCVEHVPYCEECFLPFHEIFDPLSNVI